MYCLKSWCEYSNAPLDTKILFLNSNAVKWNNQLFQNECKQELLFYYRTEARKSFIS